MGDRLLQGHAVRLRPLSAVIMGSLVVAACAGGGVPADTAAPSASTAVVSTPPETTAPAAATTVSSASTTTSSAPTTTTPVVLSEEAEAAQAIVDRWIAAWNDGDLQALRDLFSPDFSYNDPTGLDWTDGATDRFVGYVDEFELVRTSEAAEGEAGEFTWVVEFWSDASTRYPTEVLDLDIVFDEGTILHIDEHRHRDG